jgi:hypothetical protein
MRLSSIHRAGTLLPLDLVLVFKQGYSVRFLGSRYPSNCLEVYIYIYYIYIAFIYILHLYYISELVQKNQDAWRTSKAYPCIITTKCVPVCTLKFEQGHKVRRTFTKSRMAFSGIVKMCESSRTRTSDRTPNWTTLHSRYFFIRIDDKYCKYMTISLARILPSGSIENPFPVFTILHYLPDYLRWTYILKWFSARKI